MELHIHIDHIDDRFVATVPNMPGVKGVADDADTAVRLLTRAVNAYVERIPPSPFAAVRKRLSEPGRGPGDAAVGI